MTNVRIVSLTSTPSEDSSSARRPQQVCNDALDLLPKLGFFSGLSPSILADIARCCTRVGVPAGEYVFRQDDPSDSLYIVSTGRLDVRVEAEGSDSVSVAEVGRGQIVGEMGVLTGEPRSASLRSMRDSLLLRLPKERFDELIAIHPLLTRRIACDLSERLRKSNVYSGRPRQTAKTIAVIPAGTTAETGAFIRELVDALSALGTARRITRETVAESVGTSDLSDSSVIAWLNEQETRLDFLVYEADMRPSAWTSRCIRQADRLIAVARFEDDKRLNEIEAELARACAQSSGSHPHLHLVLLHRDSAAQFEGTPAWLEGRSIEAHHHVFTDRSDGLSRLARVLAGKAVGLVLGGGGARAFAHIGAIRALEEAGITIEAIGGTSQGALVAAQYASGLSPARMVEVNRKMFREFRPFRGDFTLPFYSFVSGKRTNKGLQSIFGKTHTTDLRIPFFCVSNNLSLAKVIVHRHDPVWKAVRCSMGLPGLMPPIIRQGHLIVDGGVLNNLPVDVMQKHCQGAIVAIDVSPPIDLLADCEDRDSLSTFDFLRRKLFGRKGSVGVPHIVEILMRTAFLSSINHREEMARQADLCIHPHMAKYGLLCWEKLEELVEVGYETTREELKRWKDVETLSSKERYAAPELR